MSIDKRNKDNVDLRSIEKIVRQSIVEIMNDTSVFDYSRKLPLADLGFDSVSFVDFKMHLAEPLQDSRGTLCTKVNNKCYLKH